MIFLTAGILILMSPRLFRFIVAIYLALVIARSTTPLFLSVLFAGVHTTIYT
ncbi:DUF3096 domain-containing protein [Solimicrobium silvestre]|uniref:DUF3096 domain-containing protein n=1 Tax=Solimicrobium silvestre TaxID=2099400 RepID=UPI003C6F8B91